MSVEEPQWSSAGELFYAEQNIVQAKIISEWSAIFPVSLQPLVAHKLCF